MEINPTIEEIDRAHASANLALKNKDFDAFIDHFSYNLKYKQLNGKTIDKRKVTTDTKKYFDRIQNYSSHYDRLNSFFDKGLFVEKLLQKSTVAMRVFIFFSKKWTVEREGIYKWEKTE